MTRIDHEIVERATGKPIGAVRVDRTRCPLALDGLVVGKYLGEQDLLGKANGKEASLAWVEFVFEVLAPRFLFSRTLQSNVASQRINLALGFKYEAWPDWLEKVEDERNWTYMQLDRSETGPASVSQ